MTSEWTDLARKNRNAVKSDLVQKPISRFAPPSSPHARPPANPAAAAAVVPAPLPIEREL